MRKTKTITVSLYEGDKEKLENLAKNLGITWSNNGSISGILQAISNDNLKIIEPTKISEKLFNCQMEGIKSYIKQGKINEAIEVAEELELDTEQTKELLIALSFPEYPSILFIREMEEIKFYHEGNLIKVKTKDIKYRWINEDLFIIINNQEYKIKTIHIIKGINYEGKSFF